MFATSTVVVLISETAQMWTGHAAAMGTWWVIVTQGLLYGIRDGFVVGEAKVVGIV